MGVDFMKAAVRILSDKVGVVGSLVSTMACAMCFPAAASIGAAIGLGFLAPWESLFVKVLPLFALIVLAANGFGWLSHRQWRRTALGTVGPILVLIGWAAFMSASLTREAARGVLYTGLVAMVVFAVWDMVSPANRRCTGEGCELPADDRASTDRGKVRQ
ncbi:MerC mercury resistance protein [mine drainage metagenome]|uniref:MerC mercury resistance protein n=1 Tax=mine drainage metagenome TaxID=410659 RepID=T0YXJ3_9ZZZZ